jgi:hypothetical protein
MTVSGCLTASGDRFVLTALEPAAGGQQRPPGAEGQARAVPTTETYELINLEDQLRAHVGRQVRVVGQAEPPRVADVRGLEPSTAAGTTGEQGSDARARVDIETRTRVEMRKLRISTVTPTGGECGA